MFYSILRRNILAVFLKYVHFSILELGDAAIECTYELKGSYCKFTVIFKQEYFVLNILVEKYYENLRESFQELQIVKLSDFEQEYLYIVPGFVTFNLISRKGVTLAKNIKDTKRILFTDFNDFINEYNPSEFKKELLKFK